jgi:hypothetical protein
MMFFSFGLRMGIEDPKPAAVAVSRNACGGGPLLWRE